MRYRMQHTPSSLWSRFALLFLFLLSARFVSAQELEPRAYSPAPAGLNILILGYSYSSGNVLVDASLPIKDLSAKVNVMNVGWAHVLGIAGRQAQVSVVAPYIRGSMQGIVDGESAGITRSGLADVQVRTSLNLIGAPAMNLKEFSKYKQHTILGVSLKMIIPSGQYTSAKLINLSSNRWAFKPEVGISQRFGQWSTDFYAGAWLFADNQEFYGNEVRSQDPIGTAQFHLSYDVRPHLWAAFDATFFSGGQTTVGNTRKADLQKNARLGITFSVPLPRRQSLKFAYNSGAFTSVGADFKVVSFGYQYTWGGGI